MLVSITGCFRLITCPTQLGDAPNANGLGLYWGVKDDLGLPTPLALAPLPSGFQLGTLTLDNDNEYLLEFSFIGADFKASLWATDEEGAKSGDAIVSLDYTDERPEYRADGFFAVRGGRFPSNRNAYFRDVEVTVIPEPGTASLLLVPVAIALLAIRGRK